MTVTGLLSHQWRAWADSQIPTPVSPVGESLWVTARQFTRAGRKAAQDEWVAFLTVLRGLFVAHVAADPGQDNVEMAMRKKWKIVAFCCVLLHFPCYCQFRHAIPGTDCRALPQLTVETIQASSAARLKRTCFSDSLCDQNTGAGQTGTFRPPPNERNEDAWTTSTSEV